MLSPRKSAHVLLVLFCAEVVGCGGGTGKVVEDPSEMKVREIWQAYDLYTKDYKKPPTKTADLLRYAVALSSLDESMKSGNFVVQWGVSLSTTPDKKAVLAYPKDAGSQGGYVALVDGAIRKMSAADFNAAAKAK